MPTLFCLSAYGESLRSRMIGTRKLIDIVNAYTIPGQSGGQRVHIPEKAIDDAFNLFDQYAGTPRTYFQWLIAPAKGPPPNSAPIFNSLGRAYGFFGEDQTVSNQPMFANRDYMVIFDLNLHSSRKRFHVIDLVNGTIESVEAAHGKDSDCGGSRFGYACDFISNRKSNATPLGFFSTGDVFNSNGHELAIRLNGLEGPVTNCVRNANGTFSACPGNDIPSSIIIHSADYVTPGSAGRSHGCAALSFNSMDRLQDKIKDGALFYFYHNNLNVPGYEAHVSGISINFPASRSPQKTPATQPAAVIPAADVDSDE